jgi:hypothetical protein
MKWRPRLQDREQQHHPPPKRAPGQANCGVRVSDARGQRAAGGKFSAGTDRIASWVPAPQLFDRSSILRFDVRI